MRAGGRGQGAGGTRRGYRPLHLPAARGCAAPAAGGRGRGRGTAAAGRASTSGRRAAPRSGTSTGGAGRDCTRAWGAVTALVIATVNQARPCPADALPHAANAAPFSNRHLEC